MGDSNSIINLGDLSKPANTLINKISDAVGGIFKPYQIRRVAQAEAEAQKIHALSRIEISELQHRALQRFLLEEAKKQNNIESITQRALPEVKLEATPEDIDNDWITNFFDKCRLISDNDMQTIWSRILAGEANSPGIFSKRTIDLLSSLDKDDAQLFSSLCNFGIVWFGDFLPLVYDVDHPIYNGNRINFSSLTHLDSIGLIKFESLGSYSITKLPQKGPIIYQSESILIEFKEVKEYQMDVGHVLLSKTGEQLARVSDKSPIDGFPAYLKDKWRDIGYIIDGKSKQDLVNATTPPKT